MTQSIESMIEVLQAYQAGKKVVDKNGLEPNDFNQLLRWLGNGLTITIIAPDQKPQKVKLEAWIISNQLIWFMGCTKPAPHWIRVPSEDKEIEI